MINLKSWKISAILMMMIIIIFPLLMNITLAEEKTGAVELEWDKGSISANKYNYGTIWTANKEKNSIVALVAFEYTKNEKSAEYTHKFGRSAEIEVGIDPTALVISPNNKYIYFANQGEGTVSALDMEMMPPTILDKIKVKQSPNNIMLSPDGKYLFLTHKGDNEVLIFRSAIFVNRDARAPDGEDMYQTKIVLNQGNTIDFMAFRPDSRQIWLINQESNEIIIVDVKSLKIITKIKAPDPKHIWFSRDSETAYVTMSETDSLWAINTEDLKYDIVEIGGDPSCLVGTPDGGELLICNSERKGISIVRTSDLTHRLMDIGLSSETIVIVEGLKNTGNASREMIAVVFSEEDSKNEDNKNTDITYGGTGKQTVMSLIDLGTKKIVKRTTYMPILTPPIYDNNYESYKIEYRVTKQTLDGTNKGLNERVAELIFENRMSQDEQRSSEKENIDLRAQNYALIISTLIFISSTIFFAYKTKSKLQKGEEN